MNHLSGALAWHDAGMCVIPAMADGSKRPYAKWKDYQETRPSRDKVENWYKTTPSWGVGVVCGQISGNLEMLEIESVRMGSEYLHRVDDAMGYHGVADLWSGLTSSEHGYCETTPSGGIHILYRITDQPVPGNQKIAMDVTGKQTFAETRGEGGFVVVAPSSGTVHKSGDAWTCIAGEVGTVPEITWAERQAIHAALKEALDERVLPTYERPAGQQAYNRAQGDRPGDAFNDDPNITIHDILLRNGWKYLGFKAGPNQPSYVHPMSSDMTTHSACTGHHGSPNLYAWSGMPREDFYDKFGVLAHLEYNGDFTAAGKALKAQGYGTQDTPRGEYLDGWEFDDVVDSDAPVVEKSAKLKFEQFSEKGVGKYAGTKFGDDVRWVHQEDGWRVYETGVWRRDQQRHVNRIVESVSDSLDAVVQNFCERAAQAEERGDADAKAMVDDSKKMKTFAKSIASRRGMDAVQELMKNHPGVAVPVERFDSNPNVLAMKNGTFDLDEMCLREHRPSDMLTKELPFAYNPDATAGRWLRYLEEVLPDPEIRLYLQRAVGMALLGDTSEGAFFVLWGDTGCGKSQFLEVLNAVFGDYGATAAASAFRESRNGDSSRKSNSLHMLRGTRVVLTSETSKKSSLDEELVKRVTGGDTVTSNALYESDISWKPQFTMFMGTNFKPMLDASDGAIWRRVKPINFPNSFFRDDRPTDEREKDLGQHMIETEVSGIFNWILAGVKVYRKLGLADPKSLISTVREYREDSCPVLTWLSEAREDGSMLFGDEQEMGATQAFGAFVSWQRINNRKDFISQTAFGRRLEVLGYGVRKTRGVKVRTGFNVNPHQMMVQTQRPNWN